MLNLLADVWVQQFANKIGKLLQLAGCGQWSVFESLHHRNSDSEHHISRRKRWVQRLQGHFIFKTLQFQRDYLPSRECEKYKFTFSRTTTAERNNVFLIRNIHDFFTIYEKISSTRFRFNALLFLSTEKSLSRKEFTSFSGVFKSIMWLQCMKPTAKQHQSKYSTHSALLGVITYSPLLSMNSSTESSSTDPEIFFQTSSEIWTMNESIPYVFVTRFENGSIEVREREFDVISTLSQKQLSNYFHSSWSRGILLWEWNLRRSASCASWWPCWHCDIWFVAKAKQIEIFWCDRALYQQSSNFRYSSR